jgi:hypothetical protein
VCYFLLVSLHLPPPPILYLLVTGSGAVVVRAVIAFVNFPCVLCFKPNLCRYVVCFVCMRNDEGRDLMVPMISYS